MSTRSYTSNSVLPDGTSMIAVPPGRVILKRWRIAASSSRMCSSTFRASVVRKGTVLSVEAFEGTDEMLARANKYKTDMLIFVKTPKPRQDWRFDVPVFGESTLESMAKSGVTTACLEVDGAIILEKEKVLAQARKLGIEIFGYKAE